MDFLVKAIMELAPSGQWEVEDTYDTLVWKSEDIDKPTAEAVAAKVAELQADYDAKEYARNRADAYPSIGDQLDMQYWDAVNGTTTWKDAIAQVKADNPKPE